MLVPLVAWQVLHLEAGVALVGGCLRLPLPLVLLVLCRWGLLLRRRSLLVLRLLVTAAAAAALWCRRGRGGGVTETGEPAAAGVRVPHTHWTADRDALRLARL